MSFLHNRLPYVNVWHQVVAWNAKKSIINLIISNVFTKWNKLFVEFWRESLHIGYLLKNCFKSAIAWKIVSSFRNKITHWIPDAMWIILIVSHVKSLPLKWALILRLVNSAWNFRIYPWHGCPSIYKKYTFISRMIAKLM